ncbi:hypothetical protein SLEP1_g26987 [Rubroshorea leprosula]|uniref:Uncharacterized protein n=1 Tax=Rubroshorea leprosula TaxID=152421 RepID=A0AAV5JNR6_9ROSI|nr:hypothetical protein SLEP1_g26987 [Rubroshorea leprosula]
MDFFNLFLQHLALIDPCFFAIILQFLALLPGNGCGFFFF